MKMEIGAHDVKCPYCGRIIPARQPRAVTAVGHGVIMRRALLS